MTEGAPEVMSKTSKKRKFPLGNFIKITVTAVVLYIVYQNIQWRDNVYLYDGDTVEMGMLLEIAKDGQSYKFKDIKSDKEVRGFINRQVPLGDDFYVVEALPEKAEGALKGRKIRVIEGDLIDYARPEVKGDTFNFMKLGEDGHTAVTPIAFKDVAGGVSFGVQPGVPNLLRTIDMTYFLWAFFMVVISQLLPAFRWRILMNASGMKIGGWKAVKLVYMGYFVSQVVPSIGDVFRCVVVAKESAVDKATAALSVIIDRVVGLFSVVIIGSVTILCMFNDPKIADYRAQMLIPLSCLLVFSFIYFSRTLRKFTRFELILEKLPLGERLKNLEQKVFAYRDRVPALIKAFALTAVVQVNFIFVNYLLARALGLPEGHLSDFFVMIPIIVVIVAIPISMGGFGVREGLFMTFFATFGMNSSIGVTTSILQWVILMIWTLPGGLALLSLKKEYKSEPFS